MVTCVSRASVSMARRNCSSFSTSPLCALFARRRTTRVSSSRRYSSSTSTAISASSSSNSVRDIKSHVSATSLSNAHARATHSGRLASASSVSRHASACPRSFVDKSCAASLTRCARAT